MTPTDLNDPKVYGTYRVLRGGGWFDEHWSCRASVRRRSPSDAADRRCGIPPGADRIAVLMMRLPRVPHKRPG
jgi:hypothetical protein